MGSIGRGERPSGENITMMRPPQIVVNATILRATTKRTTSADGLHAGVVTYVTRANAVPPSPVGRLLSTPLQSGQKHRAAVRVYLDH
jgi:hypothetical protein